MNLGRPFLLLCLALMPWLCLPVSARAWGRAGHSVITDAAIRQLPPPLRTFFTTHRTLLTNNAANEPSGTHYLRIDYYPEFFTRTFPRDLAVLTSRYGASVVTANGKAPWTAVTHYGTLRTNFMTARTPADWTNLLNTAAILAHFLEDIHSPLHVSTNSDGQTSGQGGLHGRFETTLLERRFNAGLRLATNTADCVFYPSLRDAIFDGIDATHPHCAVLFAADHSAYTAAGNRTSATYYQRLWDDGCSSFTPALLQRAAAVVASAWYSAWREAGFPQPPGVPASQVVNLHLLALGTNGCRLGLLGDAGQRLELQTATTSANWTSTATLTNLDGRIEITVPALPPARFYRALLLP